MKKWEIWIISLPFGNGREQRGVRPCIILADTGIGMILVIPLTSSFAALRFPHTVEINKSEKNGLEKDSIALVFQIQSIDANRFINKIGELEESYCIKITDNLNKILS